MESIHTIHFYNNRSNYICSREWTVCLLQQPCHCNLVFTSVLEPHGSPAGNFFNDSPISHCVSYFCNNEVLTFYIQLFSFPRRMQQFCSGFCFQFGNLDIGQYVYVNLVLPFCLFVCLL